MNKLISTSLLAVTLTAAVFTTGCVVVDDGYGYGYDHPTQHNVTIYENNTHHNKPTHKPTPHHNNQPSQQHYVKPAPHHNQPAPQFNPRPQNQHHR